ncbi:MAG: pirin family protein [Xanthomonadales bacterium]|nr:pirin family protein [Xanthomonadales bacterium]
MSGPLLVRDAERGRTRRAWLDARHSFSFGDYYRPDRLGFAALRVLNEDRIAPGQGFAEHGHANMEIVTVMLAGTLRHRDSLGHEELVRAGEAQVMSAGRGIRHSEWNASTREPAHLLQLWLQPEVANAAPRHAALRPEGAPWSRPETVIAAGEGGEGLPIRSRARIAVLRFAPEERRSAGRRLGSALAAAGRGIAGDRRVPARRRRRPGPPGRGARSAGPARRGGGLRRALDRDGLSPGSRGAACGR